MFSFLLFSLEGWFELAMEMKDLVVVYKLVGYIAARSLAIDSKFYFLFQEKSNV